MLAENNHIPFLSNFGIFLTYKCQVQCPHCIVQASPLRKEQLKKEDAFNWIQQLASYQQGWIKILALTGGEPFFDIGQLFEISEFARKYGFIVTVVTNAFWADSVENGVKILTELKPISNIAFSTDVYHQKYIPVQKIKNAVAAAIYCHKPYLISVCTENRNDVGYLSIIRQLQEFSDDTHIRTATALPVGRAQTELDICHYETSETPPVGACTSDSPIIFPDGRVVACIGPIIGLVTPHPLLLGNLHQQTITEILEKAQTNTILHMIRVWGPHRIISMIQKAGLEQYLPHQYITSTICDTCYQIMSNPMIVKYLEKIAGDYEIQKMVAYARAYYLDEPEMMKSLGLNDKT
jgi:organic radical activating enzyme